MLFSTFKNVLFQLNIYLVVKKLIYIVVGKALKGDQLTNGKIQPTNQDLHTR
jgi:hypothetical protein